MLVLVHLHDSVEALGQRTAVSSEADDGEDNGSIGTAIVGAADFEEFGAVARVDVVAGGQARVAGQDAEVGAGDAEGGAAVVGVAGE